MAARIDKGTPINGVSIAANSSQSVDIETSRYRTLQVYGYIASSTAADLGLFARPFNADGTIVLTAVLPSNLSNGPTTQGSNTGQVTIFNVSGMDKVRVTLQNKNATTPFVGTLVYYLSD